MGVFTDELIYAIGSLGHYIYKRQGGDLTLKVEVVSKPVDKIGYNYDREGKIGKLQKNLVATEGRLSITARVTVCDTCSGDVLIGPTVVSAHTDYDYVDYDSVKDLSFVNAEGHRQSSIAFSLGQLDTIEGAQADAAILVYRELAQKIVAALLVSP